LLLDKLRDRLRLPGVDVESEARAAADKRADMRVKFIRADQHIALPIEVKKENNDTVWTAWQTQLQRLYTIDPAARGYGIYLVLWFGYEPRATPEGIKPLNAQHLAELLRQRIPSADQPKITVQVLDLSLPAATAPPAPPGGF
jgi:hypothetical protein